MECRQSQPLRASLPTRGSEKRSICFEEHGSESAERRVRIRVKRGIGITLTIYSVPSVC